MELTGSVEAEKAKVRREELGLLLRRFQEEKAQREEDQYKCGADSKLITALINKLNFKLV